ncbi:hypothetical protein EAO71_20355 [Streptomyces sp. ms191]|uniref:hypothetical protein n=1 Tax=Streptomyces sp. ms191 TaxID=1827978 RepID=UPI0011CD58FE|nr:hypothetical protein [Streptomyces sp. ms191]TXS30748.1 hypothetical protein EAO71_20355 [Streptomyces sp. ms191]
MSESDAKLQALEAEVAQLRRERDGLGQWYLNAMGWVGELTDAIDRVHQELSDCDDDNWMVRAGDIRAALKRPGKE